MTAPRVTAQATHRVGFYVMRSLGGRLQRKVVAVVIAILVAPMVVTGILSANWVSGRMDVSIESWLRESARANQSWLNGLYRNGQLFADLLEEVNGDRWENTARRPLISARLEPLAKELGISFAALYDLSGQRVYTSTPLESEWQPDPGQPQALIRVEHRGERLLAAVTVTEVPRSGTARYRLVVGALFDKPLLQRLGVMSGLKTRLFYPSGSELAKAFDEEESAPLRLRLPPAALERLQTGGEWFSPEAEEGAYWGLYTPVMDAGGRLEAVLFSGLAHGRGDDLLADRTALALAITLLGALPAGLLGLLLSRLVVRPVEDLRDGVLRIAAQDFRTELPVRGGGELGDLARAFNTMAARLREARDEQQREFQRDKIAALGELSLAMAHEIRNPIGVLSTAAQLLDKATDNPERRADLTAMIREETARLNGLLRDFQQLARHRRPQFAAIPLEQPLEAAIRRMLAGRPEAEVVRDYRHAGQTVQGDEELLQQAWSNLIKNALEAIGDGPVRLTLRSRIDGEHLALELEDNGPGIPIERAARLFEPFFTTKESGSGLGLTIATTLADANAARLDYVPGRGGACFRMRFSLAGAVQ